MSEFDRLDRALPSSGARVLVAGLGASGEAAARRLLALGADVTVADAGDDAALRARAAGLGGARVLLKEAGEAGAGEADLLVASPGVPPSAPPIAAARRAGVPIWSEVELGWRLAADVPMIGVTGTNGKTTVTRMIASILERSGAKVAAAGNIGTPLCDAATTEGLDAIAVELSSFQLQHIVSFRARVAVMLNVADDHLDWHGSLESYAAAKARIFENQVEGDVAVFHETCRRWAHGRGRPVALGGAGREDAGMRDGWIAVSEGRVVAAEDLAYGDGPMLSNAIASAAATCAFGVAPEVAGAALRAFVPLPHRMEPVGEAAGVRFVNDSKATNPHAALAAVDGTRAPGVVLIAGGKNKGLDLGALRAAASSLRAVIAIGESRGEIARAFEGTGVRVTDAGSMDEAVDRAFAAASPGDVVLLSPACASFDMFADYKARGEAFRAAVKRLATKGEGGDAR